jgi:Zn-dependent protease with chaperone function
LIYFIFILIIFPGIYAYSRGRRFLKMERDDDFAWRYFKCQQGSGLVFWLCLFAIFGIAILDPALAVIYRRFLDLTLGLGVFIVYLLVYTLYVAGFSLVDSRIREDRFNLFGRVSFNIRLLSLIAWPYVLWSLAAFSGPGEYRLRMILLCAVFVLLYFFAPYFWRVLLRAREMRDPLITGPAAGICGRLGIKPVRIFNFSAAGLKFANAFAVAPGLGVKSIFISEYARANLPLPEQVAVFAHEVGHMTPVQVFRRSIALVLPFFLITLVKAAFPSGSILIPWGLLVGGLALARILVPGQAFEKEADLFASQAVGDPEVVIRGLQKIYQLGLLPQRFALAEERRFSHPSLARRIKYLRRQAGKPLPRIEETREFEGTEGTAKVVFSPEAFTVHYQNGKTETVPYDGILGMLPRPRPGGSRLTVRFRDRVKVAGFNLKAGVPELAALIEVAENYFSDLPPVDEARFRRSYYLTGALVAFFGLLMTFFYGPGLLILGIIGLVRRNKRLYLSYAAASATAATAAFFLDPEIGKIVVFSMAACVLACLLEYAVYRQAPEPAGNAAQIAFYVGCGVLVVQTVVIVLLRLVRMPPPAEQLYKLLFLNLSVLSIGLVIGGPLREIKRQAVVLCDLLEIVFFIFINIRL